MNSRPYNFRDFSIGFEHMLDLLDQYTRIAGYAETYPYYNITGENNKYAITLAVAGFGQDDLKISVQEDKLRIEGKLDAHSENEKVLYSGIANRSFIREFNLAESIEVIGAELTNGLLTIRLEKVLPPEKQLRRIPINQSGETKDNRRLLNEKAA